jgi:hypothetical protein
MKKGQPPELFEELTLADTKDSTAKAAGKFTGTDNPRHFRVKLSHPRQSRGFIFVSPSKGQKREAPKGAVSQPQLELIVMSVFFVLISDVSPDHLLVQSNCGHKVTSGPKVLTGKILGLPGKSSRYRDRTLPLDICARVSPHLRPDTVSLIDTDSTLIIWE